MNSRSLIALAVFILAVLGGALWFLQTTPQPVPLPELVKAPPSVEEPMPVVPSGPSQTSTTNAAPAPELEPLRPAAKTPAALADWEVKIDNILRANPGQGEAANSATAQTLIQLLPTLPPDGQTEAAQHISHLLADKDYPKVLPIVKNPSTPEDVLDLFVTDLMNRQDTVKLPTLLEIAKMPNHPQREEATAKLLIFFDADYGTDWVMWDAKLKEYLKKQAAKNAGVEVAPR